MLRNLGLCVLCLTCAACGGQHGQASHAPANTAALAPASQSGHDPAAYKQTGLDQLRQQPVPEGVDPALWRVLTARLTQLLETSRTTLAAPTSLASAPRLELNTVFSQLEWGYYLQGDYDQNGEVNVSDLQPLGVHYGQRSDGGPFPPNSVQAVIDGDNNGELNIADLQSIGVNYGRRASQYNIYYSDNFKDYPASPTALNGPGATLVAAVLHESATGAATAARLQYFHQAFPTVPGRFYWVRPSDGVTDGTPSNIVSTPADNNMAPHASFMATPTVGDAPLAVTFDASTSFDVDGAKHDITDIKQFQWDFDGDGSYDQFTAGPTVNYTYSQAGSYQAGLRIYDAGGAFVLAQPVAIQAQVGGQLPPVPQLLADRPFGHAVLQVTFDAAGSTDPGGGSLTYSWDFNGDGAEDLNTGSLPAAAHSYQTPGSYLARLRVTNDQGLSATTSMTITVASVLANLPPQPTLSASALYGLKPLNTTFKFDLSTDPDGSIVLYELDFEGDGTYDVTSTTLQNPSHEYAAAGVYFPVLRVTDNRGDQATTNVIVHVVEAVINAPVALLTATPGSGNVPLNVELDASGSTDPGGTIIDYAFDFESDGTYDVHGPAAVIHHVYVDGTGALPSVCVTDASGASLVDYVDNTLLLSDPGNQPPAARISTFLVSDSYPVTYVLDASASTDPDGTVTGYSWDFEGDGHDDAFTGSVPFIQHAYGATGFVTPQVTLYDNDGATDIAVATTMKIGRGWRTSYVPDSKATPFTSCLIDNYSGPHRRVLVASAKSDGSLSAKVARSMEDDLTAWEPLVDPSADLSPGPVGLTMSSGLPGLFYGKAGSAPGSGLRFVRASNHAATSWTVPYVVNNLGQSANTQLIALVTGGKPAAAILNGVSNRIEFCTAANAFGSAWQAQQTASALVVSPLQALGAMTLASGNPAVALMATDGTQFSVLRYIGSFDTNGTDWPASNKQVEAGFLDYVAKPGTLGCAVIDGNPAIVYSGPDLKLSYRRSTDALGTNWPGQAVILGATNYTDSFRYINLLVVDGLPQVICQTNGSALITVRARDAHGESWEPVLSIDKHNKVGSGCSAAYDGHLIAVSYSNQDLDYVKLAWLDTGP